MFFWGGRQLLDKLEVALIFCCSAVEIVEQFIWAAHSLTSLPLGDGIMSPPLDSEKAVTAVTTRTWWKWRCTSFQTWTSRDRKVPLPVSWNTPSRTLNQHVRSPATLPLRPQRELESLGLSSVLSLVSKASGMWVNMSWTLQTRAPTSWIAPCDPSQCR